MLLTVYCFKETWILISMFSDLTSGAEIIRTSVPCECKTNLTEYIKKRRKKRKKRKKRTVAVAWTFLVLKKFGLFIDTLVTIDLLISKSTLFKALFKLDLILQWIHGKLTKLQVLLTVCSYHVTYAFQSESTLYNCLNVKELLAPNRPKFWNLVS